ncbi:MAG: DMT family transporter [Methanobacteriota archaeon]
MAAFLGTRLSGYLAIVAASVLFGAWATVGTVLTEFLDPLAASFYTQIIPGFLFLPFLRPSRFRRSDLRLVAFLVVTGSALGPVLYFTGISQTTPASGVLLQNTEALFTILFAFLFLHERLARRGYVALAAIAFGAFVVATDFNVADVGRSEFLLGNLLLIGSAACWASNNNIVTALSRRVPIRTLIAVQLLLGTPLLAPLMLARGVSFAIPVDRIPIVVVIAFGMIGIFSLLFYHAFRTIGAMRTGAVLSTSPVWGLLIALAVFPQYGITAAQAIGAAIMVPALLALYLFEPRTPADVRAPATRNGETLKPAAPDGPKLP